MDLNLLYSRHQVLLMHAESTPDVGVRVSCLANADRLAEQICSYQHGLGAAAAGTWAGDPAYIANYCLKAAR